MYFFYIALRKILRRLLRVGRVRIYEKTIERWKCYPVVVSHCRNVAECENEIVVKHSTAVKLGLLTGVPMMVDIYTLRDCKS